MSIPKLPLSIPKLPLSTNSDPHYRSKLDLSFNAILVTLRQRETFHAMMRFTELSAFILPGCLIMIIQLSTDISDIWTVLVCQWWPGAVSNSALAYPTEYFLWTVNSENCEGRALNTFPDQRSRWVETELFVGCMMKIFCPDLELVSDHDNISLSSAQMSAI